MDSAWWPHASLAFEGDLSSLKSKVPLTMRGNAASFYRSMNDSSSYNFDYFLLASVIMLALSFLGGIVQNKGGKRVLNILSLIFFSAGVAIEVAVSRSIIKGIIGKNAGKLLDNLFWLGIYHGIFCNSWQGSLSLVWS